MSGQSDECQGVTDLAVQMEPLLPLLYMLLKEIIQSLWSEQQDCPNPFAVILVLLAMSGT